MSEKSELWFEEKLELDSGRTLKIRINRIIEQFDSPFQRIEVYDTIPFGKMLVHDGVIMCTEWDEHAYHEMIAHVPLFTHARPERVLVVGGGDGGTIREVLRHPSVVQADLCEIDKDVIRLARKYLPDMSSSLDDSRVGIFYEDGAKFIQERKDTYDIIIVDSSDPIGPAEVLFSEEFYVAMRDSLREDGIAVTQSESFYYHGSIVKKLTGYAKKHYAIPAYYNTIVPTYPSGIIGFTMCSKKYHPIRDYNEDRVRPIQKLLRYYNPDIHRGSFALPNFIKDTLDL